MHMRNSHDFARDYVAAHAKTDDVFIECFFDDDSDATAFVFRDADLFYCVALYQDDARNTQTLFVKQCASRTSAMLRLALFVADEYDEALDMRAIASAYL